MMQIDHERERQLKKLSQIYAGRGKLQIYTSTGKLKTTTLLKYGTDITMLAQMGKLDPMIGREKEMEQLIEALSKRQNSNACLVGDAGVGKTAIVEALARRIGAAKYGLPEPLDVPPKFVAKMVFSIDMARLGEGAMHGVEFERRLKEVFEEVRASEGWVILFLDDVHDLLKDRGDGVATILKSALPTNNFKCIVATKPEEYRRYIERDGSLKRMFETIQVCEPSREDCIKMVQGISYRYEQRRSIVYTQQALVSAVDFSKHYTSEVLLPAKAINLIDKAGARAHRLCKTYVTEAEIKHVVSTLPKDEHVKVVSDTLLKYGTDITMLAQMGKLKPVIGRQKEVYQLIIALSKRRNSNACLIGDAGVGKTAIVEALAIRIAGKSVCSKLRETKVLSIDMCRLAHGAIHDGEFEKMVKDVFEEVRASEGRVILFIDDLHYLIKDRGDRVASILKSALATPDFKCICATTAEEYRRYIDEMALNSRFESIQVCEPSREECIKMLEAIIHKYENHHGVKYDHTALVSAVDSSKHYNRKLLLPGKAINLIDKAGATTYILGKTNVTTSEIDHIIFMDTEFPIT